MAAVPAHEQPIFRNRLARSEPLAVSAFFSEAGQFRLALYMPVVLVQLERYAHDVAEKPRKVLSKRTDSAESLVSSPGKS